MINGKCKFCYRTEYKNTGYCFNCYVLFIDKKAKPEIKVKHEKETLSKGEGVQDLQEEKKNELQQDLF